MRRLRWAVAISCALSLLEARALTAAEWPDPAPQDPAVQRQADDMARGFQGAFLIARAGRVLASRGLGKANRTTGEDNAAATSFRLASLSKPLTATAIMQLYE